MGRFSFLRSARQAPASGKARSDFVDDEDFAADGSAARRSGRQKEAADPTLPEKKRARRRLVGAITLSLTAAVVLPLVFDPEPKPVSQDIAINVSTRSKPAPVAAAEPAQAAPAPQAEAGTSAVPVAAAAVAGTAAVAVAAKAATAPAQAAAPKPAAKPAEPAAPAAKPAEPKAAASEQGKYIIQVAALGSQKKAAELQAKLKSAGVNSHTQKVATQNGERIRVRVGPLASKKEVDGVCAKLIKIKQQCTLIPG